MTLILGMLDMAELVVELSVLVERMVDVGMVDVGSVVVVASVVGSVVVVASVVGSVVIVASVTISVVGASVVGSDAVDVVSGSGIGLGSGLTIKWEAKAVRTKIEALPS